MKESVNDPNIGRSRHYLALRYFQGDEEKFEIYEMTTGFISAWCPRTGDFSRSSVEVAEEIIKKGGTPELAGPPAEKDARQKELQARRDLDNAERSLRREGWKISRSGDWQRRASRPEIEFEFALGEDWEEKRDAVLLSLSPLPCEGGKEG